MNYSKSFVKIFHKDFIKEIKKVISLKRNYNDKFAWFWFTLNPLLHTGQ